MREILLFGFLGISTLLPWNAYISSTKYYDYRMADTIYIKYYESIFCTTSNLFGLITNFLLIFVQNRYTDFNLIVFGFGSILVLILLIMGLTFVDEIDPFVFLLAMDGFILISAILLMFALVGMVRMVSKYSDSAITAMSTGQALSGIVLTILNLSVQSLSPSRLAFVNYSLVFVSLSMSVLLCFKHKNFLFTDKEKKKDDLEENLMKQEAKGKAEKPLNKFAVLFKAKENLISIFLVLGVTLSTFPSVTNRLPESLVATQLLIYNIADFLGIITTFKFYVKSKYIVLFFCFTRIAFLPLFERMIHLEDGNFLWTYSTLLHLALGISNGFFSSNSFILAPTEFAERKEVDFVATAMMLALGFGLCCGSSLSALLV